MFSSVEGRTGVSHHPLLDLAYRQIRSIRARAEVLCEPRICDRGMVGAVEWVRKASQRGADVMKNSTDEQRRHAFIRITGRTGPSDCHIRVSAGRGRGESRSSINPGFQYSHQSHTTPIIIHCLGISVEITGESVGLVAKSMALQQHPTDLPVRSISVH